MRAIYVIGHPIGHSLSPAMHNAALAECGIDAKYSAADVDPSELGAWVAKFRESDALGFNVTVPHKEAIVKQVDQLTGDATLVGAVNTVMRSDGEANGLIGTNTDTTGFRRSLAEEAGESFRGQSVLLLGAGGAARAIALVALQDGATELVVANRHVDRAERLLGELAATPSGGPAPALPTGTPTQTRAVALDSPSLPELIRHATVVVNATSVGLRSTEMPVDPGMMTPGRLAVDIVYNPPETAFLAAAARAGARTLPGLGMLVYQAAAAFTLWTGVDPPVTVMRAAAERALQAVV